MRDSCSRCSTQVKDLGPRFDVDLVHPSQNGCCQLAPEGVPHTVLCLSLLTFILQWQERNSNDAMAREFHGSGGSRKQSCSRISKRQLHQTYDKVCLRAPNTQAIGIDFHLNSNTTFTSALVHCMHAACCKWIAVLLLTDLNTDSLLPIYGLSRNEVLRDQSILLPTSYEHT